jgi:hypothetical protein
MKSQEGESDYMTETFLFDGGKKVVIFGFVVFGWGFS